MPNPRPWPEALEVEARSLWESGMSAGVVAEAVGKTRNAIIGKARRAGWDGSKHALSPTQIGVQRRKSHREKVAAKFNFVTAQPVVEPMQDDRIPVEQRRTIFELTDKTCRWPCGDVGTEAFFYCGGVVEENSPYCPAHSHRAFTQPVRHTRPSW